MNQQSLFRPSGLQSGVKARVSYVMRDHNDEAGKDIIVGIIGGRLTDAEIESLHEHLKRWRA